MKAFALGVVASVAVASSPASAATVLGATTLSSPTYNRTLTGTPPATPSSVGTAVHYQTTGFTVATTGSYVFLMSAIAPVNWDTFLSLYQNSFNPAASTANFVIANDDSPSVGLSGFTTTLTAGVSYFAVASGFSNTSVGSYSLAINGPGAVNVAGVPEPASWAMMILGLGMAGYALRRRPSVRVRYA